MSQKFSVGDRVTHKIFGDGTVVDVDTKYDEFSVKRDDGHQGGGKDKSWLVDVGDNSWTSLNVSVAPCDPPAEDAADKSEPSEHEKLLRAIYINTAGTFRAIESGLFKKGQAKDCLLGMAEHYTDLLAPLFPGEEDAIQESALYWIKTSHE